MEEVKWKMEVNRKEHGVLLSFLAVKTENSKPNCKEHKVLAKKKEFGVLGVFLPFLAVKTANLKL